MITRFPLPDVVVGGGGGGNNGGDEILSNFSSANFFSSCDTNTTHTLPVISFISILQIITIHNFKLQILYMFKNFYYFIPLFSLTYSRFSFNLSFHFDMPATPYFILCNVPLIYEIVSQLFTFCN